MNTNEPSERSFCKRSRNGKHLPKTMHTLRTMDKCRRTCWSLCTAVCYLAAGRTRPWRIGSRAKRVGSTEQTASQPFIEFGCVSFVAIWLIAVMRLGNCSRNPSACSRVTAPGSSCQMASSDCAPRRHFKFAYFNFCNSVVFLKIWKTLKCCSSLVGGATFHFPPPLAN